MSEIGNTAEMLGEVDQKLYCQRCGRLVTDNPLKVDDNTLKDYVRSRLGQQPFAKVFSAMGGMFKVYCETADADIFRRLEDYTDISGSLIKPDAQILAVVSGISRVDRDNGITTDLYSADSSRRLELLSDVDAGMTALCEKLDGVELGIVRRACKTFVLLNNILMEQLVDENFYEGVGLL